MEACGISTEMFFRQTVVFALVTIIFAVGVHLVPLLKSAKRKSAALMLTWLGVYTILLAICYVLAAYGVLPGK